jgi:hypothetical protein
VPPAAQQNPQTSLYETTIDNPGLADQLARRQKLKDAAAKAGKDYRAANDAVKTALEQLDLGADAPVRIGDFVVRIAPVASRSVAFETSPTQRLVISPLPEE